MMIVQSRKREGGETKINCETCHATLQLDLELVCDVVNIEQGAAATERHLNFRFLLSTFYFPPIKAPLCIYLCTGP